MPSFPIELLDSANPYRSGLPAKIPEGKWSEPYPRTFSEGWSSVRPGIGSAALQLIPYLLMMGGSSDPNVMKWREAQTAQTSPDQARSVPDNIMAMPLPEMMLMLKKFQSLMPTSDQQGNPIPQEMAPQMPMVEVPMDTPQKTQSIQELADMIYQRKGRD